LTPWGVLPSHHDHDIKGVALVKDFCKRFKVPKSYQSLAEISSRYHTLVHKSKELTVKRLVRLLEEIDVFRRKERFEQLLIVCEADAKGRIGVEISYPQADYLRELFKLVQGIRLSDQDYQSLQGSKIKAELFQKRVKAIEHYLGEKQ
jgi:tRNA nucleotidyltransferase (CCA-adding enzyme)